MSEPVNFAKMAADLDSHPKIRRAGRDGRDVYLFVLRRVALLKTEGRVPVSNIDPGYLAYEAMMTEDEALRGVQACLKRHRNPVTGEEETPLLAIAHGDVIVEGWSDDWGRKPMSNAERQRRFRDRKKATPPEGTPVTESDEAPLRVTRSNASNGSDQTRSEDQQALTGGSRSTEGGSGSDSVAALESADSSSAQGFDPLAWSPGLNDANVYASIEAIRIGVVVDVELKKFRVRAAKNSWSAHDCELRWAEWLLKARPTTHDVREAARRRTSNRLHAPRSSASVWTRRRALAELKRTAS
jgi:hypothetical protein